MPITRLLEQWYTDYYGERLIHKMRHLVCVETEGEAGERNGGGGERQAAVRKREDEGEAQSTRHLELFKFFHRARSIQDILTL